MVVRGVCRECGGVCTRNICLKCHRRETQFIPTPEQIKELSAEVRSGWTRDEEMKRRTGHRDWGDDLT